MSNNMITSNNYKKRGINNYGRCSNLIALLQIFPYIEFCGDTACAYYYQNDFCSILYQLNDPKLNFIERGNIVRNLVSKPSFKWSVER